jgi:hypothetical protein
MGVIGRKPPKDVAPDAGGWLSGQGIDRRRPVPFERIFAPYCHVAREMDSSTLILTAGVNHEW